MCCLLARSLPNPDGESASQSNPAFFLLCHAPTALHRHEAGEHSRFPPPPADMDSVRIPAGKGSILVTQLLVMTASKPPTIITQMDFMWTWEPNSRLNQRSNPTDGEARELRCGLEAELFFDVRTMHVHCLWTEMQAAGNFIRAPAFTKQAHHFQFAVA